jgi:hypothetical protein
VLALLLVAGSLRMSNFAAAIAIGLSGVDSRLRLRSRSPSASLKLECRSSGY